ncbi:RIC1 family protein [Sporobolomyces koalae]|uniref:RIC1 family protein n=1 Tax=Sporobolomyces koalae TaxID=500713 RepID=UPI00316C0459
MYFPSPLPTTRLSLSTSFTPTGPSAASRPSTPYRTPGRPPKGKFKGDFLGGVQEEEGEQVLQIVLGPRPRIRPRSRSYAQHHEDDRTLWAVLAREEVSVWSIRPKVVLAKLKRTPVSLRTHGSNHLVHFHSSTRLVVTTTSGHTLLYSIAPVSHKQNHVYVLPGGDKVREVWPQGAGEGQELEGICLQGAGERSMQVGDGVGCVCVTRSDLLIAVQDPPSLRIIPFPVSTNRSSAKLNSAPSSSRLSRFPSTISLSSLPSPLPAPALARRGSGWEGIPGSVPSHSPNNATGGGDSDVIVLDDWDWLVGRDRQEVTITQMIAIPLDTESESEPSEDEDTGERVPTKFIMLTSDGRAYHVTWAPSDRPSPDSNLHSPSGSVPTSPTKVKANPFSPPLHHSQHPFSYLNRSASQSSSTVLFDIDERSNGIGDERAHSVEWEWSGVCFHPNPAGDDPEQCEQGSQEWIAQQEFELDRGRSASTATLNTKMNLVAIGCEDGTIAVYTLPSSASSLYALAQPSLFPRYSHMHSLLDSLSTTSTSLSPSRVTSLAYTSDGLALAVGWQRGWSVWSVFGRLGSWSTETAMREEGAGYGVEGEKGNGFEDHFLGGVRELFWGPGDSELFVLCPPPVHPKKKPHDEQLFVIPFAKSAVTTAHTPDNTKNAFLTMDDRVLVYRGADQPDMSVINPESDVWQHIKIPANYMAHQHPIRYACISSDARLIAIAGRRGLTHYNALSGRWKLFEREAEEDAFQVVGGMSWWGPILIAGCVENGQYQLRMFSRDQPLTLADTLFAYPLDSEPLVLSIFDNSLLVYTADNTFYHFLIRHLKGGTPKLRMCGSIGFEGVIGEPRKVRGVSWLVPKSQQRFGDPADDLNVATIIFLIAGRLVLLRPRRAASQEVKYDLQLLSSTVEFFWTHLSGIGTLENSLWGWDGKKLRIWLDALTIEKVRVDRKRDVYETVKESVGIDLDFYPLAVLMEKGIVIGVDQEINLRRTLDFAIFRIMTTTHLFLHHILRFHLARNQRKEAVLFASHYQHLVYFSHALEILLHGVLEDEADAAASAHSSSKPLTNGHGTGATGGEEAVLPRVVEFLDHFDECLQVVVNCARKTEVARWEFLFNVVGKPRDLFEKCISAGFLKVAASYLLVLHNLEPVEQSSKDTVRLLTTAMAAGDWTLCRELLRFLYSLDRTGLILRAALSESSALPDIFPSSLNPDPRRVVSTPAPTSVAQTLGPPQSDGREPRQTRTPSMPPRQQQSLNRGGADAGFGSLMGRMM